MSRTETILRVFAASPDDVADDRALLEQVISELNITWSKKIGIRLEYIGWETHSYPGVGTDPQAVINEEIGEDYDIFIGILWTRFGTATPRGQSGTAEEFERAYKRFRRSPKELKIMFYFKDILPKGSLSAIDPDQLKAVRDFRASLGEKGALYWSYNSSKEFESFLRIHLSRVVQEWERITAFTPSLAKPTAIGSELLGTVAPGQAPEDNVEDEGLMDLIEQGEQRFEVFKGTMGRMSEALTTLGSRMETRTREMNSFIANNPSSPKHFKKLINFAADDMSTFMDQMHAEIPLFSKSYTSAMEIFGRAAVLLTDLEPSGGQQISDAYQQVYELRSVIEASHGAVSQMRAQVSKIPRLTTGLNHAKRGMISTLNQLDQEFSNAVNVTSEIEKLLQRMLPNEGHKGLQ